MYIFNSAIVTLHVNTRRTIGTSTVANQFLLKIVSKTKPYCYTFYCYAWCNNSTCGFTNSHMFTSHTLTVVKGDLNHTFHHSCTFIYFLFFSFYFISINFKHETVWFIQFFLFFFVLCFTMVL